MENRIKLRRNELGLTLEEVGDACGVGKSTVRKWENGLINDMGRSKIVLLAKALQVSPLFILEAEEVEVILSDREKRLLHYFNSLNDIGKKRLIDNATDLSKLYNLNELNAAHERSGATAEDKAHDDAIMDDENF